MMMHAEILRWPLLLNTLDAFVVLAIFWLSGQFNLDHRWEIGVSQDDHISYLSQTQ